MERKKPFSINPFLSCLIIAGLSVMPETKASSLTEPEFSGQMNLEYRQFFVEGEDSQDKEQPSVVIKPELYWGLEDYNSSITFIPFYRYDHLDNERTHADIRELKLLTYWDDYEFGIGINKVFWGVTEAEHLVDVINQTDAIEAVDGEDKLGQPMAQFSAIKDWGVAEFYILPYFRERTFSGRNGRLRTSIPVNTDNASYESSDKEHHVDFATRYSKTLGDWDLGLSYFQGTDRTPYLIFNGVEYTPYYAQAKQTGLDIQGALGNWVWKLEAVYKDSWDTSTSTDAAFEYTMVGVFGTVWDLGLLSEYLYDSRGTYTYQSKSVPIGQNDLFAGLRLALNDEDSTQLLLGMSQDLDNSDVRWYKVEASTRLTNEFSLSLDGWASDNNTPTDTLYSTRKDDYIQLALEYYF